MTSSWIPSFPFLFSIPRPFGAEVSEIEPPGTDEHGSSRVSPPPLGSTRRSNRFPRPPPGETDSLTEGEGSCSASKRLRDERLQNEVAEEGPDRKKRKRGIVGSALATALDAAVFSTAVGYSAYRLWKHPPTKDDVDALASRKQQLTLTDSSTPHVSHITEAPPPYSQLVMSRQHESLASTSTAPYASGVTSTPSRIPRLFRHPHEPRARDSPRSSVSLPSHSTPLDEVQQPASPDTHGTACPWTPRDPLANIHADPLPEFQPYSNLFLNEVLDADHDDTAEAEDKMGDFEEDEEMTAVSERLRNLIETGREALASRPREWSSETSASTLSSNTRVSTTSSTSTGATSHSELPQFEYGCPSSQPALPPAGPPTQYSAPSSQHSRRRSLDTFARTPKSIRTPRSDKVTTNRGHRHTQSFEGAASPTQLPDIARDREEIGAVREFEKVLRKSRASLQGDHICRATDR